MRHTPIFLSLLAFMVWIESPMPSSASTITPNPESLQSGMTYEFAVTMSDTDSAQYQGTVGAKSWAEPLNPVGEKGWTHTSAWTALDLSGLTGPTVLTVQLDRAPGGVSQLFPAFSLYSGWETVNSDLTNHTFNNVGNISWATNLTYIGSQSNIGGPDGMNSGTGLTSVSKSWVLNPGLYTLDFGGNPSFAIFQQGYHDFAATLTTSPVPVPAAAYLFGSGLIGLAGLARRRKAA